MNKSWHTYEWAIPPVWISHVTHLRQVTRINESRHTCTHKWVMSQDSRRKILSRWIVAQVNAQSDEGVMLHKWMSHVTRMNGPSRVTDIASRVKRTCVAVCCSVLQRVAACCSVLQHVAVCCSDRNHQSRQTYAWVTSHIWMSLVKLHLRRKDPSRWPSAQSPPSWRQGSNGRGEYLHRPAPRRKKGAGKVKRGREE